MISFLLITLVAAQPVKISTRISGSIESSLVKIDSNRGPALAAQVARLIQWRGDPARKVHANDDLKLLYQDANDSPELLALNFAGQELSLRAYQFLGDDGVLRYYDDTGQLVEPRLTNPPAPDYVQITEVVQSGRGHRRHQGLDLKAKLGATVVTPFDAHVSRVNWSTHTNGHCIELIYSSGLIAQFLHLDFILPAVQAGARLKKGTPIGRVGSTGHSGAPHLHYALRSTTGQVLDPLQVHGTSRVTLTPIEKDRFLLQIPVMDAALNDQTSFEAATR